MPKIKIENIYAEFDPKTGFINLTTKDERLKKKPFKISVTGNSESYETLLNLLEEEVGVEKISLSDRSKLVSPDDLVVSEHDQYDIGLDARNLLNIGENLDGIEKWNLATCPHTLICGNAGLSISLVNPVLHHANHQPDIQAYVADCIGIEIGEETFSSTDTKIAKSKQAILEMVDEVHSLVHKRLEMLDYLGSNHYTNIKQMKSIFFVIDSLDKLPLTKDELSGVVEKIDLIGARGGTTGIYMFVTMKTTSNQYLDNLRLSVFGRIVTNGSSREFIAINKKAPNWAGLYTNLRGRCIVTTYGEQSLVQTYYIPKGI